MDVEDLLRDDVSIKTHSAESYPIDDFRWFSGHTHETPDSEKCNDRIDDESEVWEGDAGNHRIWMDDDVWAGESRTNIASTGNCDPGDRMEELVGGVAEISSVSECYESEYEYEDIFLFHIIFGE